MTASDIDKKQASTEMQTVDAEGMPCQKRLPTAEVFRRVYKDLTTEDQAGAFNRAKIRGMRDGNAPHEESVLRDAGQAYRSNFNDRMMAAILDQRDNSTFSLLMDVSDSISVSFTPGIITDPVIASAYAHNIARSYSRIFKNDSQIAQGLQKAIRDMDETGLGTLVWPDKYDWRFKGIKRARTTFNTSAAVDLSDLDVFMVMDTMTIAQAFRLIEKASSAESVGWNIQALQDALCNFYYQGTGKEAFDGNLTLQWDAIATRIRQNETSVLSRQYEIMSIVHGWSVERSGKVTHQIIALNAPAGAEKFLYEAEEESDSMEQVCTVFNYSFGEGTLKSVKGLGHEIYAMCLVSCRRLNSAIDTADLAGSLLLKNGAGGDNLAFSFMRAGPITLIDKSLEPIQSNFNPNIDAPLAVRSLLTETMNNNVGIFRPRAENPNARDSQKTAEQIRYEAGKESTIEADRLFAFYLRVDAMHQECFRRLLDPKVRKHADGKAKEQIELFWTSCLSLGVPIELLRDYNQHIQVRATRSIGGGSPAIKLNNLLQAKNATIDTLDEAGRRSLNREIMVTLAGSDNADEFHPPMDRNQIPSDAAAFQTLENNDILEGTETLVGADQNHYIHATTCLAMLVQMAQSVQQDPMSMEPEKFVNALQYGFPHLMRHLEYLSKDITRKNKVEELMGVVKQIAPIFQQAAQMAQQIQQAKEQERQQLIAENQQLKQQFSKEILEAERKNILLQAQIENERTKTENLNSNRDAKTQAQLQIQVEKMGAKLAMDSQAFQQKMMKEQAQLQADIAKAQTEIQLMLQKAQAKGVAQ